MGRFRDTFKIKCFPSQLSFQVVPIYFVRTELSAVLITVKGKENVRSKSK